MAGLRQAWVEFGEALQRVAPRTSAALSAAPSPLEMPAAERTLGLHFPEPLADWFSLSGFTDETYEHQLLPAEAALGLTHAVKRTLDWREMDEDDGFWDRDDVDPEVAGTVVMTWRPEYVFIGSDGSGGGAFVDCREGLLYGCVRRWTRDGSDDANIVAGSIPALLAALTAAFTRGWPVDGWVPELVDQCLRWMPAPRLEPAAIQDHAEGVLTLLDTLSPMSARAVVESGGGGAPRSNPGAADLADRLWAGYSPEAVMQWLEYLRSARNESTPTTRDDLAVARELVRWTNANR